MMMKCRECVFWKPGPGMKPEGWGKCARLSGDEYVTLLASESGEQIGHVRTPPAFGCTEAEPAVQVLEVIEVYCQICGETVEHSIDAGCSGEAEAVMAEHLREHREEQERGGE